MICNYNTWHQYELIWCSQKYVSSKLYITYVPGTRVHWNTPVISINQSDMQDIIRQYCQCSFTLRDLCSVRLVILHNDTFDNTLWEYLQKTLCWSTVQIIFQTWKSLKKIFKSQPVFDFNYMTTNVEGPCARTSSVIAAIRADGNAQR